MTGTPDDPRCAVGRRRVVEDVLHPWPARALAATFGFSEDIAEGAPLPLAWHWLYFLEAPPHDRLGRDGHEKLGAFLPDAGLPRRMWASGALQSELPLTIGATATRTSEIVSVEKKSGRSGRLLFVTVRHTMEDHQGGRVTEDQVLVYRDDPQSGAVQTTLKTAPDTLTERRWLMDPVRLFRYSALTFNGHRIHYDRRHSIETEGYGGLVVHGPLLATLMLQLIRESHPDVVIKRFSFRGTGPIVDGETFRVGAHPVEDGIESFVADGEDRVRFEGRVDI